MGEIFTSGIGFASLLSFYVVGAVGALIFHKKDSFVNAWQSFFAIAGSLWGVFFSVAAFFFAQDLSLVVSSKIFPVLSFSFRIDSLSSFFIFIISLIALFCSIYGFGYVKHFYRKYDIGALGFFYNIFILGMLMVVSAANGILFLLAWEIMSLASYFLVVYDRNNQSNVKAGFLYLVMTHVGTAFIIIAFLLLYKFTGSFDFSVIQDGAGLLPDAIKNGIFVLALVGFGTKAGIIPLHIWLPSAHPAAPSHVSALMSGVMIKTGVYMMIRFFFDLLGSVPLWWGVLVLVLSSVSAVLGVLYALTEHDIKKLLAFHSIENIGIILLGVGSALVFSALGNSTLAFFGLAAALFHTLNHATFKSLLFLSAGSVINGVHTRNMEEYGGLIKFMPQTALFFLVGSMAISALPPFNGFFSEWMTFQALLAGMTSSGIFVKSVFVLSAGALALTGGLALACFVKAFGVSFLARPRSEAVTHAKESAPSLLIGMGALASVCLLLGIFSGYAESLFLRIGSSLNLLSGKTLSLSTFFESSLNAPNSFGSVSAPIFLTIFVLVIIVVLLVTKYLVYRKQKSIIGTTWDCGVDLKPRMEITATGFARSIMLIFSGILRPNIQRETMYLDSEMKFSPGHMAVHLSTKDIYRSYFYQPLREFVTALSLRARSIQSGNVNMYVFYILVAVIAALILL